MSRRLIIKKYQLLDASDSTTSPTSIQTDVSAVDFITYELSLDVTVDALLEVEFCNDDNISSTSVFKPLDFRQTLALDGSVDTQGVVHISNRGFKWLRLAISNNGGTGDISAWVTGTVGGA